ncbi:NUDIX hydrolase domain-like protein [Microdochium trichocladiopsis]|uniref:NUDIX hydrolase domain-like protein n=1 Tax=Microdochium trichocladiopsis TaxID=1682393 RepID=A0A9P9BMN5_9PEZI|nr:NUDIX hydrolase domain-like protein [Microdochium trichocladiopsis]KAH7017987.1 NUDIX hydrolase domain-like protein [Microdochium trichocladiopsis]
MDGQLMTRNCFARVFLPSPHQRGLVSRSNFPSAEADIVVPGSTPTTASCLLFVGQSQSQSTHPVVAYAARLRATMATGKMRMSNLDLMRAADAFPYPDKPTEAADHAALMATLYTLLWQDGHTVLGYLREHVVDALLAVPEPIRGPVTVDRAARTIHAFENEAGELARTATVGRVMAYWREQGTFEVLRGWRDELWPVYRSVDEVLYSVERSGAGLLGVLRHGVDMMGYVLEDVDKNTISSSKEIQGEKADDLRRRMKIWIPRRSSTKQTHPGMLDSTVAGGLMTGEVPFECMLREADEEASLPEDLMRQRCKHTGIVTYMHITDTRAGGEAGHICPEMQWVYDIELPADVLPKPKDGEVAGFELMSVEKVQDELAKGSFEPACALVLLDFFVRHGILTRGNEPDHDEIVARMHRKLPLPGPHLAYAF